MRILKLLIRVVEHRWLTFTILALLAITTGSLLPLAELPELPGSDKTHHLIAYAGLVFPTALRRPPYWLSLVFVFAAWSGVIELIQPFVNRYGEWLDLFANCIGLLIGIALASVVRWIFTDRIGSQSSGKSLDN